MDVYGCSRTKYDIPLNHLDYSYISSCNDKNELEKIIKILRSGKEGTYPDLEKCAENRMTTLDPQNKILRKPDTLKTLRDIDKEEWKEIDEDLQSWMHDVKLAEEKLSNAVDGDDALPPVRSIAATVGVQKKSSTGDSNGVNTNKRVKPRDYREWDKFDIDAELNKADEQAAHKSVKQSQKPPVCETVNTTGLSNEVKQMKAEREKNKGNEAFHAGDYEEALVYYSRSLVLRETVAARNNRAQTYLKLKNWNQALDDCEAVLKVEPDNLKARLRRAVANQGLTRYPQAKKDLEVVLAKEPNNKQALEVMNAVNKALSDQKPSGRRMVIEEVDGSDSEDVEAKLNEKNVEKSAAGSTSSSARNHFSDDVKTEGLTHETVSQPTPAAVSIVETEINRSQVESVQCSGDRNASTSLTDSSKHPCSAESKPCVANGDGGGQTTVPPSEPPSEPLPPAVQALKDEGNDLFRKGQYGDAIEKYSAAIQILSGIGRDAVNLSTLYSNRAACLIKIGDCQGCIIDCDAALALCPGSAKALLRRAMAHETLEKYRQAYVDYRQVLKTDRTSDVAQQGSDRCANMLQKLDGPGWRDKLPSVPSSSNLAALVPSAEPVESQSAVNEKTFETCKTQGNTMFSKGDYLMAIDLFTKCIDLFPDRVVPYTNRALCYLRLNQYNAVLSDCNQALSLEFHNVKALFRRAQAYKMLERYEESMIDLETLLKIDPSNSAAKKELQAVMKLKEEEREKRLQACLRKHRQRIPIEEVDSSSDEEQPKKPDVKRDARGDKGAASTPVSRPSDPVSRVPKPTAVPQLNRVTAFEFTQAWTSLKGTSDIEPYVKLLDQIQPADVPKVITNKLEGDFLLTAVRYVGRLVARGDAQRGYEFLASLSTVPRFDTVLMFMSDSDKKEIAQVFQELASTSSLSIDSLQLASTRKKYGV